MSRIVVLTILIVIFESCLVFGFPPENRGENVANDEVISKTKTGNNTVVYEMKPNKTGNDVKINVTGVITPEVKNDQKQPQNQTISEKTISIINSNNLPALNEPALHRLFYVLLGLSTVTVCYVAMKMYRVRKGVTRPTHVRKYGVLAQRSDIEMEPLHLDDDEDDDTVFDVGAHANR
nr:membrane protein FAM174-like [Onthophagus taurus]